MDAGDQELMDDVSVNLAEVISGKLQNCRMRLSSSVDLDTDPKGPGIFLMLSSPPDLLSAAYVQLAQFMADRAPMEECPGCGRVFIPSSGKQKYCARVAPARLAGTAGNKNKLSSYGSNAAAIEVRS
jgi:hypothetical protein